MGGLFGWMGIEGGRQRWTDGWVEECKEVGRNRWVDGGECG